MMNSQMKKRLEEVIYKVEVIDEVPQQEG